MPTSLVTHISNYTGHVSDVEQMSDDVTNTILKLKYYNISFEIENQPKA